MPGPVGGTESRLGSHFCGAYYYRMGKTCKVSYIIATVTIAMMSINCLFHTIRYSVSLHFIQLPSFRKVLKDKEVWTLYAKA